MNIQVYSKTNCKWAKAITKLLDKNKIPYEEKDMLKNEIFKQEAFAKSGAFVSPTLDIDGYIMTDTDVDSVRKYLESINILKEQNFLEKIKDKFFS